MDDKQFWAAMAECERHKSQAFVAKAKAEEIADRPNNAQTYRARAQCCADLASEYEAAATEPANDPN